MEARRSACTGGIMTRPRVLIAHPYVYPSGGGNSVAAWTLQALREEFDLTLGTLGPVDYDAVNRSFGTSLRPDDFRIRLAPAGWRFIVRHTPTPGALLEQSATVRWAQNLDRARRFDVLMSTQNEADFGRAGLQYVHYPWTYLPRPDSELRWFHRIPGVLGAYRGFCQKIARATDEGLRRSVCLANSAFVAGRVRETHGVESKILYPPVPGGFPCVAWGDRIDGIVALGRMHGCKRWETAIEIVDGVRRRGLDVSFTLISHRDDIEYGRRIQQLAASRPWFRILDDLPRDRMVEEVARHRYGLHTMEDEHFGIAPAELQRAGCITFVHRSGGPMEIVGHREELMFEDTDEGSARICRVMQDAGIRNELRRYVSERAEFFSEERFCAELRNHVRNTVGC